MKKLAASLVLFSAGLLVACGTPIDDPPAHSTPASGSAAEPFPSRPRDLPIENLDPCTLLSVEQRDRLGVGEGRAGQAGSVPGGGAVCQWQRFPSEPQDAYLIAPDPRQGAAYVLDSDTDARAVLVNGYGAAETQLGASSTQCVVLVDVVADQSLWVQYDYDGSTVPMTRQLACDKAKVAAEMAIQTLVEQSGG